MANRSSHCSKTKSQKPKNWTDGVIDGWQRITHHGGNWAHLTWLISLTAGVVIFCRSPASSSSSDQQGICSRCLLLFVWRGWWRWWILLLLLCRFATLNILVSKNKATQEWRQYSCIITRPVEMRRSMNRSSAASVARQRRYFGDTWTKVGYLWSSSAKCLLWFVTILSAKGAFVDRFVSLVSVQYCYPLVELV